MGDCFVQVLFGAPVPVEKTALEIVVKSLRTERTARSERRLTRRRHLNLDLARNGLRDLTLQIEYVAHGPLVSLYPPVASRSRLDQLRADHDATVRTLPAAFHTRVRRD